MLLFRGHVPRDWQRPIQPIQNNRGRGQRRPGDPLNLIQRRKRKREEKKRKNTNRKMKKNKSWALHSLALFWWLVTIFCSYLPQIKEPCLSLVWISLFIMTECASIAKKAKLIWEDVPFTPEIDLPWWTAPLAILLRDEVEQPTLRALFLLPPTISRRRWPKSANDMTNRYASHYFFNT